MDSLGVLENSWVGERATERTVPEVGALVLLDR